MRKEVDSTKFHAVVGKSTVLYGDISHLAA